MGAPLPWWKRGYYSIDIDNHELNVLVSDQEMAINQEGQWQPHTLQVTTGYLARYVLVTSADRGAVLQVNDYRGIMK